MSLKQELIHASTFPSQLIYSVDVPEVQDFKAEFVYNFFVADETVNDSGEFSEDIIDLMNITGDIIKRSQSGTLVGSDLRKIPRYVKLTFNKPIKEGVNVSKITDTIDDNFLSNIVFEDDFAQGNYSAINNDSKNIVSITNNYLFQQDKTVTVIKKIKQNFDSDPVPIDSVNAASSIKVQEQNADFTQQKVNQYFENLEKVNYSIQLSNSSIYDLFISSENSLDPNSDFYKSHISEAKARQQQFNSKNFSIADDDYKPSIKIYQDVAEQVDPLIKKEDFRSTLIGYIIEKVELFTDGTQRTHEPIIIPSGNSVVYIDNKVRYAAIYVYRIRSLFKIVYPGVVNNATLDYNLVESIIASKKSEPVYIESSEYVAPPPPAELGFVWNYDRFNPTTMIFDATTNQPFPNTGVRGSLMLHWTLPVNTQLDIKKFQVFRRKSIDDPFELIKMFDFDNSVTKFPLSEQFINSSLVETSLINRTNLPSISVPMFNFYDDDFMKNSEYIYALGSIDAHGLVSNYSEQFKVKFDSLMNKLTIKLVSIAGAPRQYPNMYLQQDLFLDSIKTANKNTLKVYVTPECYRVIKNDLSKIDILNLANDGAKYVINFINTDKGMGGKVDININKTNINPNGDFNENDNFTVEDFTLIPT